ncbi:type III secretion system domain-containing protein [Chitinimonas sp. PSY-7]|uniref:type III secretion system domain-containing protein n=1 Tax=Chitinimonas sp. PSY-7 TaxID=3459088 RepID=UPI00403FE5F6
MINPALQSLYALWWQPCGVMHPGWWTHLNLDSWRSPYQNQPAIGSTLNKLIGLRLGHDEHCPVPKLTSTAQVLLEDVGRFKMLGMALGLWALQCPEYLFLRTYRQALKDTLDDAAIAQLQALFPVDARMSSSLPPEALPAAAAALGTAWISHADDHAVAAARLLLPPPDMQLAPAAPVMPVLSKLLKWL